MKTQTLTFRKCVTYLNNESENGGFWLPNIQRAFVWKEEQIERLFDSVLREYPIGTLLVWKNKNKVKKRKFIDNYHEGLKLTDFYHTTDDRQKFLVLDGQQRLQSIFIALKGSYNGKELFINILSGELKAPEDMKYEFSFKLDSNVDFPWIKFKNLIFTDKLNSEIKAEIISLSQNPVSESDEKKIERNVEVIRKVFCTDENLIYQEVDSIDRPTYYSEDDIVEIFIRANSGGTPLGKSDLLFSLLISSWEDADRNMEELLDELNKTGYKFSRDFILKTSLVLLGKGARYNVEKFREEGTREDILDKWEQISDSIKFVKDYIYGKTFIKTDKVLPSYLTLIPIIYFHYKFENKWNQIVNLNDYIVRTLLTGAFSGTPDNLIDKCIRKINEIEDFNINELYGIIRDDGRSLELSKDTILNLQYGQKEIHLLFNLWYNFNYEPAFVDNQPEADHIFPQSLLKTEKITNPETGRQSLMKYRKEDRDQIANLMLLTKAENGFGGKTDIPPEFWFVGKNDDYLDLHLIPKDPSLWTLSNFEQFLEKRKELILNKFSYMLVH